MDIAAPQQVTNCTSIPTNGSVTFHKHCLKAQKDGHRIVLSSFLLDKKQKTKKMKLRKSELIRDVCSGIVLQT